MIVLGIETTCDETGAAVVESGAWVRSSVVASQHELHAEYAGVVPEIAARAHVERIVPVVRRALGEAGVGLREVDAVAVAHRPGLIGALLVGVSGAKALAWSLGVPLVGVDHIRAHLYAPLLGGEGSREGVFPALGLVVSGGHTALYRMDGVMEMRRVGGTIDDAVGEAFDKVAAVLGLGHPGGPAVERLAGDGDARAHEFPVSRLGKGSLDFSFSGLKTAVLYAVRGTPEHGRDGPRFPRSAGDLSEGERADVAASFQRAAVRAVELKVTRALGSEAGEGVRSLLVGGGVSANGALRAMLERVGEERGVAVRLAEMRYCVDNAAMIAGLAHHRLDAGERDGLGLLAVPTAEAARG